MISKISLTPSRDLSWPPQVLRMVSLARLLHGAENTATVTCQVVGSFDLRMEIGEEIQYLEWN